MDNMMECVSVDTNKSPKLDALLSLYSNLLNEILFFQKEGDSTSIINVFPVVIIPILERFGVNSFIITIVCLMAPCIQVLSLQRGLQAHTFVAILRGYAANIEERINELIEDEAFIYNSVLIDKYIASQKVVESKGLKTSWAVTAMMHYVIEAICVAFFVYFNLGQPLWAFVIAGVWFVAFFIFITKLCIDFSKKEKKRYDSKVLAATLNSNKVDYRALEKEA